MSENRQANLLLHICCAPCAEYPLEVLLSEGKRVRGLFYNPNIHPAVENKRRLDGVRKLCHQMDLACDYTPEVEQQIWEQGPEDTPGRLCAFCYRLRLYHAAQRARALGIPAFTTTLLVSPYQQHDLICDLAERAAFAAGVDFYYRDFRSGFRHGQDLARKHGLYRQKYCGCIDSLRASRFKDRIQAEHQALLDHAQRPATSDDAHT